MQVQRRDRARKQREVSRGGPALLEFLERSLDKGLLIEGRARVPVLGIEVLTLDFRAFVASCEKYLEYAGVVEQVGRVVELHDVELDDAESDVESAQLPLLR